MFSIEQTASGSAGTMVGMTWKDTLEIGLKDDAPFRRDNLPEFQKNGTVVENMPGDPTRSPEEPGARDDAEVPTGQAEPVAPGPTQCTSDVTEVVVSAPRTSTVP